MIDPETVGIEINELHVHEQQALDQAMDKEQGSANVEESQLEFSNRLAKPREASN